MSEGSASTGRCISDAFSCQGAANLDSSHAMEATKSLVKVISPHTTRIFLHLPSKQGEDTHHSCPEGLRTALQIPAGSCRGPIQKCNSAATAILQTCLDCRMLCSQVGAALKSHTCSQCAPTPPGAGLTLASLLFCYVSFSVRWGLQI